MDQTSSDNRTDQPFTIRKAETNEDLQEIAALADVICGIFETRRDF